MTNFEKIKAMDLDKLAGFIAGLPGDHEFWDRICSERYCKYADGEICLERNSPRDCEAAVKSFLKSEAEV